MGRQLASGNGRGTELWEVKNEEVNNEKNEDYIGLGSGCWSGDWCHQL